MHVSWFLRLQLDVKMSMARAWSACPERNCIKSCRRTFWRKLGGLSRCKPQTGWFRSASPKAWWPLWVTKQIQRCLDDPPRLMQMSRMPFKVVQACYMGQLKSLMQVMPSLTEQLVNVTLKHLFLHTTQKKPGEREREVTCIGSRSIKLDGKNISGRKFIFSCSFLSFYTLY